jgi:NADPH-dependent 2,4-dienoyl-CoA reductase/sulfur reductase-like enzyme
VRPKTAVTDIREHVAEDGRGTGRVALTLTSGEQLVADHVVVAVGIEPNVELARSVDGHPGAGGAHAHRHTHTQWHRRMPRMQLRALLMAWSGVRGL